MALNVEKVTEFIAPEADWLDNRYCGKDDDTFYRELPEAEVLWHVLQSISGDDLGQARHLHLVHKLGAGRTPPTSKPRRGWASRWRICRVQPIPADNPLLGLDNVVLTPHVTWYTVDTMRRYLEHAVDCRGIAEGRELANVVNG